MTGLESGFGVGSFVAMVGGAVLVLGVIKVVAVSSRRILPGLGVTPNEDSEERFWSALRLAALGAMVMFAGSTYTATTGANHDVPQNLAGLFLTAAVFITLPDMRDLLFWINRRAAARRDAAGGAGGPDQPGDAR